LICIVAIATASATHAPAADHREPVTFAKDLSNDRRAAMGVLPFVAEDASSAALAFDERPIDLVHLARTTLGDSSLEGEMLEAFGSRATMLILRMQQAARSSICAAAQALKGSARGIGAWRVASAAQAVELAAESGGEPELRSAVDQLGVVAEETRAAIAELLRAENR
jgi:HPt (histidine-containing phosphotransfer) domain-containing protein